MRSDVVASGTVVSLNVGLPRTHVWRDQEFLTAIVKEPVEGPLRLHGVNFDGDDQSNRQVHGGADRVAYAYAVEDYDWWAGELGMPLEPGRFGENLTLAGIDLTNAVAGERWAIGTAVVEATLPRVPCMKLAMRMDDPGFIDRFARSLRTGAMLRLIAPGEVRRGDVVRVIARPGHGITLAEMGRIRFFEHDRRAELLAIPGLPARWRSFAEGGR